MAKKKNNIESKKRDSISSYYDELVWMSYRYCIGRHTIAAHMHANDIAQNEYDRFSAERKRFMASDIRREMETSIAFSKINIRVSPEIKNKDVYFYWCEYTTTHNIRSREDLKNIKSINVVHNDYTSQDYHYEIDEKNDGDISNFSLMDIEDLSVWSELASLFDDTCHKYCKASYNGKEEIIEYFDAYIRQYGTGNEIDYKLVKMPVNDYLKSPYNCCYINEKYIIEDNISKE